jgi:hypothetical protein
MWVVPYDWWLVSSGVVAVFGAWDTPWSSVGRLVLGATQLVTAARTRDHRGLSNLLAGSTSSAATNARCIRRGSGHADVPLLAVSCLQARVHRRSSPPGSDDPSASPSSPWMTSAGTRRTGR